MARDERSRDEALVETLDVPESDPSPSATIRAVNHFATAETLVSPEHGGVAARVDRALPAISVDIQGSLAGAPQGRRAVAPPERDLEVVGTLGEGGMGRVFVARQHSLERDVAIKTARDHASPAEREALLAEGVITGSLEHPGIIPIHALGMDGGGRPVLVMKRVEGVAWIDLIHNPSHPGWEGWGGGPEDRLEGHLDILIQVCNAVHFAASKGVVHRDIKPANVLIGRFGDVYLADWGIACRLDQGDAPSRLVGTPCTMAPEMACRERVDARTDVYLLGATLHEILTGAPRHEGASIAEVLDNARVSAPVVYDNGVPEELAALANRATSREPHKRPSSALEMRRALEGYRRHKSSAGLARSAAARLDVLRSKLGASAGGAKDEDLKEIDQLIAETRFGLTQAIAEWPDNHVAARALEGLDKLLAERRERALALEKLAREHDPAIASHQRTRYVTVVALAGVALTGLSLAKGATRAPSPKALFVQSLVPFTVVAAAMIGLRHHMWKTSVNRRAALLVAATVTSVTLGRGLGIVAGSTSAIMLLHDALIGALLATLGGFILFRWVFWLAPIMATCAVVSALSPDHAMVSFSVCSGLALTVAAVFVRYTHAPESR